MSLLPENEPSKLTKTRTSSNEGAAIYSSILGELFLTIYNPNKYQRL